MDLLQVKYHHEPVLENPLFLEGLPGVGNVGKLAVQHLVDHLEATLWFEIFSRELPPQVTIEENGTVRLVRISVYAHKGERDLILLTGDHQPMSSEGQYALCEMVLEKLAEHGCKEMLTLGGYGLGGSVEEPTVLGAATSTEWVDKFAELEIVFEEGEPAGGIIGASGLFLGLGKLRGMEGICLMGETSGYMVDPKAARAVIDAVGRFLGTTFDTHDLEEKAKDIDRLTASLQEPSQRDDLQYIG